MPRGQWVAFEGDEPHRCTQPRVNSPPPDAVSAPAHVPITPVLERNSKQVKVPEDFPDIEVPGHTIVNPTGPTPSRLPTSPASATLPAQRKRRITQRELFWVFLVVGILLAIAATLFNNGE